MIKTEKGMKIREANLRNGNRPPSRLGIPSATRGWRKYTIICKSCGISFRTSTKSRLYCTNDCYKQFHSLHGSWNMGNHRRVNTGRTHFKKGDAGYWLGKKRPDLTGENSSNWKGGITSEIRKIRNSREIRLWREAVFKRDDWTCQKTGARGGKLVVHHINNFGEFPELRTNIDNGITLSKESHLTFHNKYGRRNNTREQILEFFTVAP